jgi:hypothetical protein
MFLTIITSKLNDNNLFFSVNIMQKIQSFSSYMQASMMQKKKDFPPCRRHKIPHMQASSSKKITKLQVSAHFLWAQKM